MAPRRRRAAALANAHAPTPTPTSTPTPAPPSASASPASSRTLRAGKENATPAGAPMPTPPKRAAPPRTSSARKATAGARAERAAPTTTSTPSRRAATPTRRAGASAFRAVGAAGGRRRGGAGGGASPPTARRRRFFEGRAGWDDGGAGRTRERTGARGDGGGGRGRARTGIEVDPAGDVEGTGLLVDLLAADWVCDDSLPAAELAGRMRGALRRLQAIENFTEAAEGETGATGAAGGDGPVNDGAAAVAAVGPDDLKELVLDLSVALAVDRFVDHPAEAVRLFTSCILAELLRISAPEPPLPIQKLNPVAALFIDQIVPLAAAEDQLYPFRFGLLEQLAVVKTFVVFCDDETVVADLFAAAYAMVRPAHPAKLVSLLVDILTSLFDEAEVVPQLVLDAALAPLIPANEYSAEAVRLAEDVVAASCEALQVPLCNFFNAALRAKSRNVVTRGGKGSRGRAGGRGTLAADDDSDDDDEGEDTVGVGTDAGESDADSGTLPSTILARLSSGKKSKIPKSELLHGVEALLIHVNQIAPDILIYVIPNLERDLRASNVEDRLRCVKLLASLFTVSSNMVQTYPSLLADFIARAKDTDVPIRIELCTAIGKLMGANPSLRPELNDRLGERLLDKDEKVRMAAIAGVASAAGHADCVNDAVLRLVAGRVKDKKLTVRQAALRSLISVYRSGFPPILQNESELASSESQSVGMSQDEPEDLPGDTVKLVENKYPWIPASLLQAYSIMFSIKDFETASEIERALFERLHIWPGQASSSKREMTLVSVFAAMLGRLDTSAVGCLKSVAVQRSKTRSHAMNLVSLRLSAKKGRQGAATSVEASASVDPTGDSTGQEDTEISLRATFSKRGRGTGVAEATAAVGDDISARLEECISKLCSSLPEISFGAGESTRTLVRALAEFVDLHVFKKLEIIFRVDSTSEEVGVAISDVVARVGTKSALARFLKSLLIPTCGANPFSSRFVEIALQWCKSQCSSSSEDSRDNATESESDADADADAEELVLHVGFVRYLDLVASTLPTALLGDSAMLVAGILTSQDGGVPDDVLNDKCQLFQHMLTTSCLKIVCSLGRNGFEHQLEAVLTSCTRYALAWAADPEHCARHSKWATRAFVSLLGSSVDVESRYDALLASLSKRLDEFEGNLEYVIAPLASLTQLAALAKSVFRRHALGVFDFARALLMGSLNDKVRGAISKAVADGVDGTQEEARVRSGRRMSRRSTTGMRRTSFSSSAPSEVLLFVHATRTLSEGVRRAAKLLVASLDDLDSPSEEVHAVINAFVMLVGEKNGNVFGLSDSEMPAELEHVMTDDESCLDAVADMCGIARLAASCGVLSIGRNPRFFKKIQPAAFLAVVLCAQDEHPDIRIMFARKVGNSITRKGLPFRWASALALMAIDPDKDNLTEVKALLSSMIRSRRRVVRSAEKSDSSGRRSTSHLLPEAALPELLWVIAQHPDADVDRANGYAESERYLDLFFDRLLDAGEYPSVLNQYLNSIALSRDATVTDAENGGEDSSSQRIVDVARMAASLLQKKRAGRKWTIIEHVGKAHLPADMFRLASRPAASKTQEAGAEAGAEQMVIVARRFDHENGQLPKSAERRQRRGAAESRATPSSTRKRTPAKSVAAANSPSASALASSAKARGWRAGRKRQSEELGGDETPQSSPAEVVAATNELSPVAGSPAPNSDIADEGDEAPGATIPVEKPRAGSSSPASSPNSSLKKTVTPPPTKKSRVERAQRRSNAADEKKPSEVAESAEDDWFEDGDAEKGENKDAETLSKAPGAKKGGAASALPAVVRRSRRLR